MVGTQPPFCFAGFGTEWLRREQAMKTADRENQTAGPPYPAPESVVRQLKTDLAQSRGLGSKKTLRPQERCFFLTSTSIELPVSP